MRATDGGGHSDIIIHLIDKGAEVNATDKVSK